MKSLKYLWLLCLVLTTGCFISCDDDDDTSGSQSKPITVTQIYLEDYESAVPDRPVDFVRLGQMIRIEGEGFLGLKKLYINGYDTYFNVAYVTDRSMLVSVHTKTPVIDADEEVRNTIRFVKDQTETIHPFTIRAASPAVSHMSNTLPLVGETVTVFGTNLHETSKVTLPGAIEITEITNDEDGEWYSFVMPDGVTESGSIYSEGANGIAATPAYFNYSTAVLLDFDGTGVQGSWSWSETGSMIDDTDLVDDPAQSGRGKCVPIVPERLITAGGVAAGKSRVSECWTAGNDEPSDDWSRFYPELPAATPLTDIALQFDIYVPEAWSGSGHIQVSLFNNFNFGGIGSDDDGDNNQVAFYVPWIESGEVVPFVTEGWQTVTIPFSQFNKYATMIENDETPTFQLVVDDRNAATYRNFGIGFVNTDFTYEEIEVTSTTFTTRIYLDNWRIVPCKNIVISDFPDEDEEEVETPEGEEEVAQ